VRKELGAGDPAPDFTLATDYGPTLTLSDLRGQAVVLYFYPKDDTPGCTNEACDFRDSFPRFEHSRAIVLGISPDSVESHRKFKRKFSLPFTLLADDGHAVASAYGVWKRKSLFGIRYWGVERTTFVVAPDGRIAHAFPKVKVRGHADAVLAAVRDVVG
jgi:thioredoxin-dependent peroxiredoxin